MTSTSGTSINSPRSRPAADRYGSVLEQYVNAVADAGWGDEPDAHLGAPAFPAFTVGDVMTSAVVAAHEGALFKEIAGALNRNHITAVPVIDYDRKVVGVITVSDLLSRIGGTGHPSPRGHRLSSHADAHRLQHAMTATELMTAPAITTTATTTIAEAARLAARARVRSLPVLDPAGILIGIVSRVDLLKLFLRPDVDILRDVDDDVLDPSRIGRGEVHATVDDGIVTLTGSVQTALIARRLGFSAHRIAGVVDVVDQLRYLSEGSVVGPTDPNVRA